MSARTYAEYSTLDDVVGEIYRGEVLPHRDREVPVNVRLQSSPLGVYLVVDGKGHEVPLPPGQLATCGAFMDLVESIFGVLWEATKQRIV